MKVSDILKLKGSTLYTISPETTVNQAVRIMAEHDIGSLVVIQHADIVGILTFREVIGLLAHNHGTIEEVTVGKVMDKNPLICTPETDLDEVRKMMLERHARYLPVVENKAMMGVISFYDVAKAVVEAQGFENTMLKAYIRDWPEAGNS
jgi:CBS domain-containing protein